MFYDSFGDAYRIQLLFEETQTNSKRNEKIGVFEEEPPSRRSSLACQRHYFVLLFSLCVCVCVWRGDILRVWQTPANAYRPTAAIVCPFSLLIEELLPTNIIVFDCSDHRRRQRWPYWVGSTSMLTHLKQNKIKKIFIFSLLLVNNFSYIAGVEEIIFFFLQNRGGGVVRNFLPD